MNTKKLIIAVIAVFVLLEASNYLIHRERLYNIAERRNARLILIDVKAPPEVVKKRLKSRMQKKNDGDNSDADWEVYQKLSTTAEKIRRNHFVVDTSKDITPALEKIVREANR